MVRGIQLDKKELRFTASGAGTVYRFLDQEDPCSEVVRLVACWSEARNSAHRTLEKETERDTPLRLRTPPTIGAPHYC